MRHILIIFFVLISIVSCDNSNQSNEKIHHNIVSFPEKFIDKIEPETLKKALIFCLKTHKEKDSCEYFIGDGVLKIGDFFCNNKTCAFIVINRYKFLFFENVSGNWNLITENSFENEYSGYEMNDLNGDNCLDFMLKDFYVYSNYCYRVLLNDCEKKKLRYVDDFEGIMNPFYDKETKLINSFLFTNHGDMDKETYQYSGDSLNLIEKVTLEGAGIEDVENNKFIIKHFVNSNNKLLLLNSIKMENYKSATTFFDNQLFNYFIKYGVKTKLLSSEGWVQLEIK
jgi:hypothetical protein